MSFIFKKKKTKEKGGDIVFQNTVFQTSSNNVTETRSVTEFYSSSSSSKTILKGSQTTSTSSAPNLTLTMPSSSLKVQPTAARTERSLSLFETDARPFKPTTIIPNYQSPFARSNNSYGSSRWPSTSSTAQPTLNNRSILPVQSTFHRQVPLLPSMSAPVQSVTQRNTTNNTSVVPTYKANLRGKNNAIVINNTKFLEKGQERKGAEFDERNISELLKTMGFKVHVHRNITAREIMNKIHSFSRDKLLAKGDISMVIMMSHGTNKNNDGQIVPGNFTQIFGTDDKSLPIEDVLAEFSTDKCPGMIGKPKIFIFQCCRGDQSESIQADATPIRNVIRQHADMLIAYSTLPGFYSLRDVQKGSFYIQSICDVFRQHAKDYDVESLLKIVDDQLTEKYPRYTQTSNYESRGFKKCYLLPR